MVDNLPVSNQGGAGSIRSTQPVDKATPKSGATSEGGGVAFKALLEKLQGQAESLRADSETIARPEELSGAVDRAHASLQDALSLSDQLLEAFRESAQNPGREDAERDQK